MLRRDCATAQSGFTLLELLLAIAVFALLATGTSQLLAALVRADAARQAQADELRALGRAMSVMQRDAVQGYWPTRGKKARAMACCWRRSGWAGCWVQSAIHSHCRVAT